MLGVTTIRGATVRPLLGCLLAFGVLGLAACSDGGSGAASGGSSSLGGGSATGGESSSGGSTSTATSTSTSTGTDVSTGGGVSASGGSNGTGGSPPNSSFPSGFGSPEPFVTKLTRPVRIGFKDGFLYFTEMGLADGTQSRLARRDAAGNVQTLFAGNAVVALFLDDDELFFVERSTKSVFRMKYATLTVELFANCPETMNVGDVTRLGENIWLSEFAVDGKSTAIVTKPRSGGAFQDVVPATPHTNIFTYMVSAANQVYVAMQGTGGGLYKGSAVGAFALSIPNVFPRRLTADANFVYFGSDVDGRILRQAHSATMAPEVVAEGQSTPFAVAVDSGGIYWTNGPDCGSSAASPGSVAARALSGGAPVVVAANETCPQAIITDNDFVYWIRELPADAVGDDSVMRAPKMR